MAGFGLAAELAYSCSHPILMDCLIIYIYICIICISLNPNP